MANPSLVKGHFSIANELAKFFAAHNIPGNEMRLVWVVWLKTWSWKQGTRRKDWDHIALSQFRSMTGMNQRNVSRGLQSLVAKRLLLKSEKGYCFNQDYDQWVVAKRLLPEVVANVVVGSGKRGSLGSSQMAPTKERAHKREFTKEPPLPPKGGGEGFEKSLAMIIVDTYVRFTNEPAITQATRKRYKKHAEELVRLSRNALTEDNEETTDENILCVISKRFKALEQRWPGNWTPATAINWFDRILEN